MAVLAFRNVDVDPADPVEQWPYEGVVTALERGCLSDWARMAAHLRREPWGRIARDIEAYAEYAEDDGAVALLVEAIARARSAAVDRERAEVAARVRAAIAASGLTAAQFAPTVGTSASRLSTYASGTVVPSATMLIRIENGGRTPAPAFRLSPP